MAARSKNPKANAQKDWRKLSEGSKIAIVAAAAVEITLLVVAQAELLTSKKDQVRGKKWAWFLGNFVNFAGPVSFLLFGRRRSPEAWPRLGLPT
ncbi:hypothetical protein [Gulosibacter molinativorax]|uniref:Cardiolipin synthase N-terminal domain-containing protein n=1 Tax=Gulosibacter molinativorax TaxID=256821 RepID=A0ABT7C8L9_9MICO|nr:hypothetical protein [Gulosibacter molinativorax]MDJ1370981.1 hypothetical protein [Gulosibacter molinativorax]QUY62772.1 Hypotetical protein [Gulosibacter molinativorax]